MRKYTVCLCCAFLFALVVPPGHVFAARQYISSLAQLQRLAEQGDVDAQYDLGLFYFQGRGVPQDYSKAMLWYRKAAEQGDSRAQFYLGSMYQDGLGVIKDHTTAIQWLQKSVAQGDSYGQLHLGWAYQMGLGVPKDYDKAAEWYQKSATLGNPHAQEYFDRLQQHVLDMKQDGAKVDQSAMVEQTKAQQLVSDAEQGNAQAQSQLGNMYAIGEPVDPVKVPTKATPQQKQAGKHQATATYTNSIGMKFMLIPSGSFMRVVGRNDFNEIIGSKVDISKPFYLGVYEVTQEQWHTVMGDNPARFKARHNPVELVAWVEVQEFIQRLNANEGHNRYRLPTEAEWEYAARAGTSTEYSFGNSENSLGQYAWYRDNSGGKTHPVGQKKPNPWGLYDMYGNVWEWVQDWYGDYPSSSVTDPKGPSSGSNRVNRGGSWGFDAGSCRAANRSNDSADYGYSYIGFRLALSPE